MKYIDSSAFVKYYANEDSEKGSDKVKELIDKAKEGDEKLISSVLLIPECISSFDIGDKVKISECRPLSRTKHFVVVGRV